MAAPAKPSERYETALQEGRISEDQAQRAALEKLDALAAALQAPAPAPGLLERFRLRGRPPRAPLQGLYLWGGVGRGKTFLMDLFFEALPPGVGERMHFYRFMRGVHEALKTEAGKANPLEHIAEQWAKRTRVICFDEFFVSDITDAMLLGELFAALFARGVTLVTTSNVPPAGLYKDGLQRRRFLPAIALLETHTEVYELQSAADYRLRALSQAALYHSPLGAEADAALRTAYQALTGGLAPAPGALEVEGRRLPIVGQHDDVVWFRYETLCEGPRSQNDYIALAHEFATVLLSDIPLFTERREDGARRFVSLVDEFYDRGVKLICSAEAPITTLYQGSRLRFEFERTASRLLEMQSHEYLARERRA
jgi:cell division protein ZapE